MKGALLFQVFLFSFLLLAFSCKTETAQKNEIEAAIELTDNSNDSEQQINEIKTSAQDSTYAQADEMPRFPGCEDKEKSIEKYLCATNRLNNYIHNRLRYPKAALRNKIEGRVTAQFVVRPDGRIDDIGIFNDIGYGCGETVLKIIQSMNHMNERWIPGKNDGETVRVRLAIPIEFKLRDYQKEEGYIPGK